MVNPQEPVPTQEDRIMAALAHVTALLPFMGVVAPVIIWTTQKDKSRFVSFQALQATVYQLTMIVAWFVGMACYMCSFFLTFGGMATLGLSASPEGSVNGPAAVAGIAAFIIPFVVFGLMFVGGFAFVLYGAIGAIQTLRGKDFRYIVIGARLERDLQQGSARPGAAADPARG